MRRRALTAGMAALALSLWGCGPSGHSGSNTATRSETGAGAAGGSGAPPRTLVSLSPGVTATILALDPRARLVGVSDYCELPPSSTLPRLGTALTPRLEAIAALPGREDVLAVAAEMNVDWRAGLGGLVMTRSLPWRSASELSSSVRALGAVMDAAEAAEALARRLDDALDDAAPETGLRVALLLDGTAAGDGGFWFIKTNSLHGAALHGAGLRNAFADTVSGPPKIGPEQLMAGDPDAVVLLANRPLDEAECQRALGPVKALSPMRAVKQGALACVGWSGALVEGPGLVRLPEAITSAVRRVTGPRGVP